jgi:hypothetical protein
MTLMRATHQTFCPIKKRICPIRKGSDGMSVRLVSSNDYNEIVARLERVCAMQRQMKQTSLSLSDELRMIKLRRVEADQCTVTRATVSPAPEFGD